MRVFFASWPDADLTGALHRQAQTLQTRCGGRAVRRETLHMTLVFVGDVPTGRVDELIAIGARVQLFPTRFRLDEIGALSRPRLVWLAPSAPVPGLTAFVASLRGELARNDFDVDNRAFWPHVTLLRNVQRLPERAMIEPFEWSLSGFSLVCSKRRSQGVAYRELASWPVVRA